MSIQDYPRSFGFLLFDQYPLLPVSGMIDVLRDTAYVTGEEPYRWCSIASSQREVVAMNGLRTIADHTIDDAPTLDAIVVCSGLNGHLLEDKRAMNWLRKLNANGVWIGGIATGTWLMARTGLLTGKRCTLHWEDVQAFSETFPRITATRELFMFDGRLFTCSGGTAAIDMFLHLVARDLGPETSSAVARQIMHASIRHGTDSQPRSDSPYKQVRHASVRRALALMEEHVEQPVTVSEIASRAGASQKQLERLFASYFGMTPQIYYRCLRLDHARTLVRLTELSIWQIALIAGFSTTSYFSKCYRGQFGFTPSAERRNLSKFAVVPSFART